MKKYSSAKCHRGKTAYRTPSPFIYQSVIKGYRRRFVLPKKRKPTK